MTNPFLDSYFALCSILNGLLEDDGGTWELNAFAKIPLLAFLYIG
ncbi:MULTISPECIES: hypothetical protein [Psychrobacillus]|nr:hypothetical protein [Psychrobacillus psychrodurans]